MSGGVTTGWRTQFQTIARPHAFAAKENIGTTIRQGVDDFGCTTKRFQSRQYLTSVARWLIECQDANVSATGQRLDISRHRGTIIRAAKDIVCFGCRNHR